jgi:hypothetical protein
MKPEELKAIAEAKTRADAKALKLNADQERQYVEACAFTVEKEIAAALRILDQAGFVVAEKAQLTAALEPFARHALVWPHAEDNLTVSCRLHVEPAYEAVVGSEDFRRAAALLAAITEGQTT